MLAKFADFGTVSEGTLDTEDLLETFSDTLESLIRKQSSGFKRLPYRKLIRDARKVLNHPDEDGADALLCSELVDDLADALNNFAPPYAYFGTIDGDGACFGFWISHDAIRDAIHDKTLRKVDDLARVPRGYSGEVLQVSDHGNMTLYYRPGPRSRWREVWSVV